MLFGADDSSQAWRVDGIEAGHADFIDHHFHGDAGVLLHFGHLFLLVVCFLACQEYIVEHAQYEEPQSHRDENFYKRKSPDLFEMFHVSALISQVSHDGPQGDGMRLPLAAPGGTGSHRFHVRLGGVRSDEPRGHEDRA